MGFLTLLMASRHGSNIVYDEWRGRGKTSTSLSDVQLDLYPILSAAC